MTDLDAVAERFETHRDRLRGVAFRMLGSAAEAQDAGAGSSAPRYHRTDRPAPCATRPPGC